MGSSGQFFIFSTNFNVNKEELLRVIGWERENGWFS